MESWPFEDSKDTIVKTSRQVVESGAWVSYVARDEVSRQWCFCSQSIVDLAPEDERYLAFEDLLRLQPDVGELRDLPLGWQAWRSSLEPDWQRRETPRGDVFYLRFAVFPREDHPEFEVLGEGLVEAWVVCGDAAAAEAVVREELRGEHFVVEELETTELVDPEEVEHEEPERVRFYRQAKVDGSCFSYNLSPKYPVYYLEFTARQSEQADLPSQAKAGFYLSNGLLEGDPYDADFWNEQRVQFAGERAKEAIRDAGWEITSQDAATPCSFHELEEDRRPLYDEAESEGSVLFFWTDD
ncbi:MAG: hypothetical protein AAF517_17745 [Planctomycetota bacterium]